MELHEIIRRSNEGDAHAFGQLVSRYRDMAFGYARTLLEQDQMAEDAVQEALIVAFTRLDHLQEPQAFGAWLRGIVRHRCYRALRSNPHTLSWEQIEDEQMEETGSDATDPAHTALNRALAAQVQAAIADLPPAQRETVQLFYEAGLSQSEIATRLKLTAGAVNMRLHAARTRLRRRLQPMSTDTTDQPRNTGRLQEARRPVVTVQFAPNATPPLFSRLTADGQDSLCVIQHLNAGRVRAIASREEAIWTPGQEIVDTGEPFTDPLPLNVIRNAIAILHPQSPDSRSSTPDTLLPSGIKTIEVFAPLTQGGSVGIFTEWGLGVLVLLPELLRHLDQADNRQTFFVFLPPMRDAQHWQEVTREITAGNRNIAILYLPVADPISPEFMNSIPNLDSTLTLSRRLAEQAIWPCLDPLTCRSRRLDIERASGHGSSAPPNGANEAPLPPNVHGPTPAFPEQTSLVTEIRQLLRRYYTLQFSLGEEARRTLSPQEWQQIQRARKVLHFLSQPFFVAEPYTGKPGVFVTAEDALRGFTDIMAGRHDAKPREAFYMVGAAPKPDMLHLQA